MQRWEVYIDSVQSGKRLAGELEKLAVERFLRLCTHPDYYFDADEANRVLDIISCFKHTKGTFKGVPFNILPWQAFFWAWIFGLKYKADDLRVTREVVLCMAKKGGKSEVMGATAVYMTFFDEEPGAEIYSAANSADQARFSWDAAGTICKQLIEDDPEFGKVCRIYDSVNNRKIVNVSNGSYCRTIATENSTLDGVNPHLAGIDEFHAAPNGDIPKNLMSGMVGRTQPLLMFVTTRGFNPNSELARLERKHIALLREQSKDDSCMGLIFALDPDDEKKLAEDWGKPIEFLDRSYWEKSNPGLGVAPTVRGLEAMYTDAVNAGQSELTNFKVKNLNIWVRQSKSWFDVQLWRQGRREIDLERLKGKTCFAGMDLSTKWDLTCVGYLFPVQPGLNENVFIANYYCPEDGIEFRANRDKVPYREWAAEGWLTATPGNVIDYDYIRTDIQSADEIYNVVSLFYDPKFATETATKLTEIGVNCVAMKQTLWQFTEPIMKVEEWCGKGELNKGMCPILDWMFENVTLRRNASGLIMFDKDKSREKIDGMVTLAMCIAGMLEDQKQYSNAPVLSFF